MGEQEYYLVPIVAEGVKFEGKSLFEMLSVVDCELCNLAARELKLKYELDRVSEEEMVTQRDYVDRVRKGCKTAFKIKKLPEKIIIVKSEGKLNELSTMLPVTVLSENFLEVFKMTGEEVVEHFVNNEDYSQEVANFFNSFITKENVSGKSRNTERKI